jgi:hypothetical protein
MKVSPIPFRIATTPSDLSECYRLRASEYGRYYRNIPGPELFDDLDAALLGNGTSQSKIVLVGRDRAIATARLSLTHDQGHPEIKSQCQELMNFSWEDAIAAAYSGKDMVPPQVIVGEISKLAIGKHRESPIAKIAIFPIIQTLARDQGIEMLVFIMSPFVAQIVWMAGASHRIVESAQLRRDTMEQLLYLVKYRDYFLPDLVPQGLEEAAVRLSRDGDFSRLRALLEHCGDGARLYCSTTADFIR